MKLSKQLLYDRMSEYYTIHVYGAMDAQTELDCPLFYEEGMEFKRGHVYLAKWQDAFPADSTSLFVVCAPKYVVSPDACLPVCDPGSGQPDFPLQSDP